MNSNLLLIAQAGFVLLTIVFFGLLLRAVKAAIAKTSWEENQKRKYFRNVVIALLCWGVFVSIWSGSGVMSDFSIFPLNMMPVIVIPLITIVGLMFTSNLGDLLDQMPADTLMRLQVFRFFVELLLWALFVASLLPVQMTFEGRNFDILAGITGPVVAWLVSRNKLSRGATIVWNLICLALLANIVTIAILSTPSPWRVFMNEPSNTIVTIFPVSWLPGFLVPLAYTLNLFSIRQALRRRVTKEAGRKEHVTL